MHHLCAARPYTYVPELYIAQKLCVMSRKIWTGVKNGPPFRLRKTDRPCEKWAGMFPAAVVCPSMAKSDEDAAVEHLDLVDEVFIYLTESRYICRWMFSRA